MDTFHYLKIAEIVMRDERNAALRTIAERVLATPRVDNALISDADKQAMKKWMTAWCDRKAGLRVAVVDFDRLDEPWR